MSSLPPLKTDPKYKSIDHWRGIACLLVVLHHTGFVVLSSDLGVGGFEGVLRRIATVWHTQLGPQMFFVISGYCIFTSVDSIRRRGLNPWDFLRKRLWRTFPAYWVSFLGFVVVVWALDRLGLHWLYSGPYAMELYPPRTLELSQWVGNLTLTEGWRPLVGGGSGFIFTRIAWTLCYQEQFYFVCFLVLLLAPRRLYGVMAAATAAILAFRVMAWDSGSLHRIEGTFPVLWHEFAVGLAVYWRLNIATRRIEKLGIDLGLAALVAIAVATDQESAVKAAVFGLILVALRRWDGRIAGLKWLDPLKACGRRSYSIFLAHLPVNVVGCLALTRLGMTGFWTRILVVLPVVAAAEIAAGWLFYRLVERRCAEISDARLKAAKTARRPLTLGGAPAPAVA